jgi:hypothetical protein
VVHWTRSLQGETGQPRFQSSSIGTGLDGCTLRDLLIVGEEVRCVLDQAPTCRKRPGEESSPD